ncbi:odorant receptor 85c-like [Leguminivora glycinivorella]|uniref:odorant receptor 85c-like n=1 Tax=Leguminivora glycinivorella TaxID=1035111 RepID=UPI00200D1CF0|nr:odorant receptor 85c-like [Leguminivora glycinivorella]
MSEFTDFEPMFQDTYKFILDRIKSNQIYIMDEESLWRRWCWVKLAVNILAAISHTAGVFERFTQGADLVQLSTDLSAALILWQASLLYIQLCLNRKLLKNLILHMGAKWRPDDQMRSDMVAVKHEYVTTFLKWITIFYKMVSTYVFLYLMPRLAYTAVKHFILKDNSPFVMPFYVKMPFKYDNNFLLYTLVYLADYKILNDVSNLVTFDLLFMNAVLHHLRLMFVILQDDLRDVAEERVEQAEKTLKKLIPVHQDLLQLMFEVSNAFGAIFLIHLAFFSGTMCFFGFAARVHCSPESIKNLLAANIILVCIYTCCYFGQNLTDASVNIAQAAYESQWQLRTQEYKKCILFIMLRSQKAQYIRSTSFTDVSLQTFTKILNVTWSFLSLITKVYEA